MLNRILIVIALLFQIVGVIWDFVFHVQTNTTNTFFEQAHWPIFVGIILLTVAVANGLLKKDVKIIEKPFLPEKKDNPPSF